MGFLRPIDARDLALIAGWLAQPENHRWLDFGGGRQVLPGAALSVMRKAGGHFLRVYPAAQPAGIVALSNVAPRSGSATLWYVLGDKQEARRGLTTRAVGEILTLAFSQLGLRSVNAWTVDSNVAATRVLEANGFRLIGRQRRCHLVAEVLHDRLHFDLLAEEHPWKPSES